MNKLFKFAQAKGKWYKFLSFDLGGGAKLYKNFAQKLLAMSLCMAMVLCTMPLRGGSHVSEAAEGEGTVLTITATGDDLSTATVTAAWTAFDLSSPPSVSPSWSVPVGASPHQDIVLVGTPSLTDRPPTGSLLAGRADPASPWVYDGSFDFGGGAVASSACSLTPRCVGCWSLCSPLVLQGRGVQSSGFSVPSLPALLLARFSVPVSLGASAPWSPAMTVAHCKGCAVSLVAAAGAPVTVAGDYDTGWTITRTGAGEPVLDLKVGNFKVGEVTVTEAAGSEPDSPTPPPGPDSPDTPDTPDNPDAPPAATPADSSYLEAAVAVRGQQQRLRVYDPNGVLPAGTKFEALAVTEHEHIDDDHEIEHLLSYNISLLNAAGDALPMPLSDKVELCFEVLDGLDRDELEVVLVKEFDDAEFEENLVDLDGASWVKVKTDHFSPYALIDKLSPEEKGVQVQADPGPKNNVKTGDLTTQIAVAGLGMVLVLALGIMLRLITSKRKFEE